MRGILIDMKDGYAKVPGSDDLEYGHNTDGFDVSGSTLVYVLLPFSNSTARLTPDPL
jgi:hypothetical protein